MPGTIFLKPIFFSFSVYLPAMLIWLYFYLLLMLTKKEVDIYTTNRGNTISFSVVYPEKNDLFILQTMTKALHYAGVFNGIFDTTSGTEPSNNNPQS